MSTHRYVNVTSLLYNLQGIDNFIFLTVIDELRFGWRKRSWCHLKLLEVFKMSKFGVLTLIQAHGRSTSFFRIKTFHLQNKWLPYIVFDSSIDEENHWWTQKQSLLETHPYPGQITCQCAKIVLQQHNIRYIFVWV